MSQRKRVLSLDLGVVSGIGIADWPEESGPVELEYAFFVLEPDVRGPAMLAFYDNWIRTYLSMCQQVGHPVDLIAIESLALHGSNVADQAKIAAVFELVFFQAEIPVLEVSPTQVKKWAYGSTKDKHAESKGEVFRRASAIWGADVIKNDHLADAAFLAQIGFHYLAGINPALTYRHEVMAALWTKQKEAEAARQAAGEAEAEKLRRATERELAQQRRDEERAAVEERKKVRAAAAETERQETAVKQAIRGAKKQVKDAKTPEELELLLH